MRYKPMFCDYCGKRVYGKRSKFANGHNIVYFICPDNRSEKGVAQVCSDCGRKYYPDLFKDGDSDAAD